MGKRKTKRKPMKKVKDKLDTQFNCLFCNHENSIEVKIDSSNKVGHLTCKICDVNWQTTVTYLDEPVDVYSGWIDACEELNKRKKAEAARRAQGSSSNNRADSGSPPPSHLNDRLDPFDEDEDDDY